MTTRLLVVEDEQPIRDMLRMALCREGFEVDTAADSAQAYEALNQQAPDLILLDWMLPDVSGLDIAKRVKRDKLTQDIPIIMLTAKGEEEDKIRGLETGADDYVTKPFSPKELIARIKAVLRRASPTASDKVIEYNGLKLDPNSHRVTSNEETIDLGPTEFRLLHFFMSRPERVYSRSQLLDNVWGTNVFVEERTVDVHIRRLRKALSVNGHEEFVQTVRGAGYRFSTKP